MTALAMPTVAAASIDADGALRAYAMARLADGEGASGLAVESYREALTRDPAEIAIARRSYAQAIESGDAMLALRSATMLDTAGLLPRDGTLLRVGDALARRDWAGAAILIDRVEEEGNFAFLAPIIRSWLTLGEGDYVPPKVDTSDKYMSLALRYVDEHLALQALARRDPRGAAAPIQRALAIRGGDSDALRLTFAAQLAALGERAQALALLPDTADVTLARAELQKGRNVKGVGSPATPAQGFARLLSRLASDISADDAGVAMGLRLSRIATFADPAGAEAHIVAARLLTAQGYAASAVAEARKVPEKSWYAPLAKAVEADALAESGDMDAALTLARAAAMEPKAGPDRQLRLGRLLAGKEDYDGAVTAFRAARATFEDGKAPWVLLLMEGSALEQGERWEEARRILEQAAALAPNEPVVLNYLGYAQIERRQNIGPALELIKKANALKPQDASIADSLGWAHYVTGDIATAVPVLERAAAGAPADVTINEHLGDALWSAGRRFEARYAWTAASVFAEGDAAARIEAKRREGMKPEYAAP